MSKTDREIFDAVVAGEDLTGEGSVEIESEEIVEDVIEALPVEEPVAEAEAEETAEVQETEPTEETDEAGEDAVEAVIKVDGVQIPKQQYDRIRSKQKEAEALADSRKQENAALQGRLEQIERLMVAQSQPQKPQEDAEPLYIDEDTRTVLTQLKTQFDTDLTNQKVKSSIAAARRYYKEDFAKAEEFINEHGTPELAEQIRQADDPGELVHQFWTRNTVLQEVGDDPAAYRARLREEARAELRNDPAIRQELLDEMRGVATTRKADGSPAIKTAPSLASGSRAADARPQTDDPTAGMSDAAIFAQVTRKG